MDIITKLMELELPVAYANGVFAQTAEIIDLDWAKKVKNMLEPYGVTVLKGSELKYYTYNESEIRVVLQKLQYYKDNGLDVLDEKGNVKKYLFDLNNKEWLELHPGVDTANITPDVLRDQETFSADMFASLNEQASVGLTEENYDRYVMLEGLISNVMEEIYGIGGVDPEVSNNIIKLLNSSNNYSDSEILFAALVYGKSRSASEMNAIKSAIEEVLASRNQGGSLNL